MPHGSGTWAKSAGSMLAAIAILAALGRPCFATAIPDGVLAPRAKAAIVHAAAAYMKKWTDAGVLMRTRQYFFVIAISGNYAKVLETLKPRITDDAAIYLKYTNGRWVGLTAGTGFPDDDLAQYGIPKGL